jgi:hypothetical protein
LTTSFLVLIKRSVLPNTALPLLVSVYHSHCYGQMKEGADIQNAMKGYREAFHPPPPSPTRQERESTPNPNISYNSDPERDIRTPTPTPANGDGPLFDEADLDEMAAMEEMEREARAGNSNGGGNGDGDGDDGPPPQLEEEDDWEGLYD